MNKLLVPFDFSLYAEDALRYAVQMAQRVEASITIFHTVQSVASTDDDNSLTYKMAVAAKEKQEVASDIKEIVLHYSQSFYVGTANKVIINTEVRQDSLNNGLKNYLTHHPEELIIMGTSGKQDSNTASIAKTSKNPMIVVPSGAGFDGIAQIVYASNFDAKDLRVLQQLNSFNELFEGRITCLHIAKNTEQALAAGQRMSALEEGCKKHQLQNIVFEVITEGDVEEGLLTYVQDSNIDLLVTMPQEHGVVGNIFHKSLTKKLVHSTAIPLLVLK